MSYAQILCAKSDGQLVHGEELRNAHGFAPIVWGALGAKYADEMRDIPKRGSDYMGWQQLWDWVAKKDKPALLRTWELNVLHMTYDMAYLKGQEDMKHYAASCRIFDAALTSNRAHVNHLQKIANETELLIVEGYEYVAFYGMSVGENLWSGRLKAENEDEDEDSVLYNFVKNPENASFSHDPKRYGMFDPVATRDLWVSSADHRYGAR